MNKTAMATVLGLSLALGSAAPVVASEPGVRDAANMFSADALKQADKTLIEAKKAHGWEIVFETIESLGGKPIDRQIGRASCRERV